MIGYTQTCNNDVYVFFEGDDVDRLGREGRLEGIYVSGDLQRKGVLDVAIDDRACRQMMNTAFARRDNGGCSVRIMKRVYDKLVETGSAEPHEFFGHIILRGANNLSMMGQINYNRLRSIYPK